jgi:hypothetical protein
MRERAGGPFGAECGRERPCQRGIIEEYATTRSTARLRRRFKDLGTTMSPCFDAVEDEHVIASSKVTLLAQHRRMHYETLNARPAGDRGA